MYIRSGARKQTGARDNGTSGGGGMCVSVGWFVRVYF